MIFRAIVCSALIGFAGTSSAGDLTYTYTGNWFEKNDITAEPSRLIAHFVFDFDHSPGAADHFYTIKSWDVSAAGMNFGTATPSFFFNPQFIFDSNMNVVEWKMADAKTSSDWSGFSSVSSGFSYDGRAMDLAASYVTAGPYASVYDKPGVWTVSAVAAVPEPSIYLSLTAGLACLALVRRKSQA
jgi:hypothetical protein